MSAPASISPSGLVGRDSNGHLFTTRPVRNLDAAFRFAVALSFGHHWVRVTYGYQRGINRQVVGQLVTVATVEHGTCTGVLVLGVGRSTGLTTAIPLAQVDRIEQISPEDGALGMARQSLDGA